MEKVPVRKIQQALECNGKINEKSMGLTQKEEEAIRNRRTFAIISHPDAGKTTLTEKLLLYGGAIHEAGEVKSKKNRRMARSDWMKMEQERGISVSSSVMQFTYKNLHMNLLDTPGHADFSEDTYRTLTAADSAIMLLDNAKGVESQTKRLFEVCRLRKTPTFTFINKLDREGRTILQLMEEIEKTLHIECNPLTIPIGCGEHFKGIYHRLEKKLILYKASKFATKKVESIIIEDFSNPILLEYLNEEEKKLLLEEVELFDATLGEPSLEQFLQGNQTPVMFGSARANFGVKTLLDYFTSIAPAPQSITLPNKTLEPWDDQFSGFVFKIQANMDKKHRDRIAFFRIISGKFQRGMTVKHERLGREIKLPYSQKFFAEERKSIEEAYAGDILGLHDSGNFLLGDTLYTGSQHIKFPPIPQFSPEHFARILLKNPLKRKQLQKGTQQLCEEGSIQYFTQKNIGDQDPILGAVGMLQFDVLLYRLRDEYKVEVSIQMEPYVIARWIRVKNSKKDLEEIRGSCLLVQSRKGDPVLLFTSTFHLDWVASNNPNIELLHTSLNTKST